MRSFVKPSALWILGLLTIVAPGCSSTAEEDEDTDEGALAEVSKPGQFVVDMAKVKEQYCGGEHCTSKYFFGLAPHEAGLCKVDEQGRPEAACAAMEQQGLIVWDQTFRFNEDHSMVPPTEETPVVKLEGQSTPVKARGSRLNIIPMLKDTDPLDQKHIGEWLQNGDVLVYFHPESKGQQATMDRRTSHVAMYYEQKDASGKVIARHHIDNPNDYGPQFNHEASRQMPFHVFRYKPKGMSAEQSRAVGLNARNWAYMTDDRSPFADFFTLKLQNVNDLRTFRDQALRGEDIPEVYCSGLAYTNLNLGVNYPLKANMLRSEGYTREASENGDRNPLKADILAPAETQSLAAPAAERLIYEPYTPTELATAFLDNTFAALPPIAEEGKPSRRAIAMKEKLQQAIIQGFSQLTFSDAELADKAAARQPTDKPVARPETVKAWAKGYGLGADKTAAWLADPEIALVANEVRSNSIDTANKTPLQVLRDLELKTVGTRFVGPRMWLDEADHRQWALDPRMLPMLQQKKEVDMVYVGSVINCEILSAADGSNKDACDGFGAVMREWKEGGADTSTYAHYAIQNGKERTHRRFDASPFSNGLENGQPIQPRPMGKGTQVSVRASSKNAKDVFFILHTPEMNGRPEAQGGMKEAHKALNVKDYDRACTQLYAAQGTGHASCAPKQGIWLKPSQSREARDQEFELNGELWDQTLTFDLFGENGVCQVVNDKTMKCPILEYQPNGDWKSMGMKEVSRVIPKEKAFVSSTMVDIGQVRTATGDAIYNCPACQAGGAHFNQWTIKVRND